MDQKGKSILGIIIGVGSGIILLNLVREFTGSDTLDNLSDADWSEWLVLLAIFGAPIITGLFQGVLDNEIWKILLFPIIVGAIAFVITFLLCAVIYAFTSGNIFIIIAGIGLFAALAAPVGRILVIFFE